MINSFKESHSIRSHGHALYGSQFGSHGFLYHYSVSMYSRHAQKHPFSQVLKGGSALGKGWHLTPSKMFRQLICVCRNYMSYNAVPPYHQDCSLLMSPHSLSSGLLPGDLHPRGEEGQLCLQSTHGGPAWSHCCRPSTGSVCLVRAERDGRKSFTECLPSLSSGCSGMGYLERTPATQSITRTDKWDAGN